MQLTLPDTMPAMSPLSDGAEIVGYYFEPVASIAARDRIASAGLDDLIKIVNHKVGRKFVVGCVARTKADGLGR
ncbi:MAG: hypothetical protein ACRC7O_15370, partial [Fimbriiglobus sp.]